LGEGVRPLAGAVADVEALPPRGGGAAGRARALPYAPVVDGLATPADGKFKLTFGGGDAAGVCFHVRSGNRTDGPWTYTTEAAKTLSDAWNSAYSGGSHDLTVFGPNGFLRTFKNPGKKAGPEVTARHDKASGNLKLTLTNAGAAACDLTVTNAYGGAKQTFKVKPGVSVQHTVDLRASKRWYDLTVVSDTDAGFLRRLAGHVENGLAGVSDPAIATA
ncbi:phospholipase domain-containing protein, partial [Streptomyces lasiicapitis]|uniref:phospholipase domain-containing protein n=1 Tax=Streptomyces lasiicapitis TaxID=1923961 RepID=UPI003646C471